MLQAPGNGSVIQHYHPLLSVSEFSSERSRFEGKYLITEAVAAQIRSFVKPMLVPDRHMPVDSALGYQVFSLYLDSPNLALYRQTKEGVRQRYKLRVRFYHEQPQESATLEVKSRLADVVYKRRAAVTKSSVASMLRGVPVSASDLLLPEPSSLRALEFFSNKAQSIHAQSMVFVCYWREAYTSSWPTDVRLTFDRNLTARDGAGIFDLTLPERVIPVNESKVVLELKYSGRQPMWINDLVRTFQLQRCSFPKYIRCLDALRKTLR